MLLGLTGCAAPGAKLRALAVDFGFQEITLQGQPFVHASFLHGGTSAGHVLHVYIEGDGRPFPRLGEFAVDPTSRDPLMLKLMRLDPAPSLYLGRPCYNGLYNKEHCTPIYWTSRRYAPEVVQSMLIALRAYLATAPFDDIVLIGHSGGGTLAMLMARQLPQTRALVTIAANLDIVTWAQMHGYTPLTGSLNPAHDVNHTATFYQLHLAGAEDREVPYQIIAKGLGDSGAPTLRVVDGFDHNCCWETYWSGILHELAVRHW